MQDPTRLNRPGVSGGPDLPSNDSESNTGLGGGFGDDFTAGRLPGGTHVPPG